MQHCHSHACCPTTASSLCLHGCSRRPTPASQALQWVASSCVPASVTRRHAHLPLSSVQRRGRRVAAGRLQARTHGAATTMTAE
jgi:hypothetical protein